MSQDKSKFQSLSPEDVISVSQIALIGKVWDTTTVTVDELRKRIGAVFGISNPDHPAYQWSNDGIEGKVLIAEKGGGWKEGRIRFSAEFLPVETLQDDKLTSEEIKPGLDEFR
jgi:hypothetical protein